AAITAFRTCMAQSIVTRGRVARLDLDFATPGPDHTRVVRPTSHGFITSADGRTHDVRQASNGERRAMTRLALCGASLAIGIAATSVQNAPTRAIRFARVWDGSKVINDAVVVVTGDKVVSVGAGNGAVPQGAEVVDLRRYSGIPGLIDLHTHMTYYW